MENQQQPTHTNAVNVSAETKQNADDFMATLGSMFETIENLANDGTMKEGDYVKLSREFVKLSQMKERVKTTIIYIEQERIARRGRVLERKNLSKQQKLDDEENYAMCPSCEKVLKKKSISKHIASGICKHIADVKGVVAYNTGAKKKHDRRVKLSRTPIMGGRSIAQRSLVLAERLNFLKLSKMGGHQWILQLVIKVYHEVTNELVVTHPLNVWVCDERKMHDYRPVIKYGTKDKILWVKKEPIDCPKYDVEFPVLLEAFIQKHLIKREVPWFPMNLFWKKTRGKWQETSKGKEALEKTKQPEPKPEPKCESCGVYIDLEKKTQKDIYHEDVKLWVCWNCQATADWAD
jgi:hypothetical protein